MLRIARQDGEAPGHCFQGLQDILLGEKDPLPFDAKGMFLEDFERLLGSKTNTRTGQDLEGGLVHRQDALRGEREVGAGLNG